jgi:hypothetical protein
MDRRIPIGIALSSLAFFAIAGWWLVARAPRLPVQAHPVHPDWWASGRRFGEDPIWRDGQAEVAHYEATRTVYGKPRSFPAVLITVLEDLDTATYTKADPPYLGKGLLPVLKLHAFSRIETDNYPYHHATTVFVSLRQPTRLVKLTQSSQEWCGSTFKLLDAWSPGPALHFHSYWANQGDGAFPLDLTGPVLLEDQLPVTLRSLPFRHGFGAAFRLIASVVDNQARAPAAEEAHLSVSEPAATPGASRAPAWKVVVQRTRTGQELVYWFDTAPPHVLMRFSAPDGRELVLRTAARRRYW